MPLSSTLLLACLFLGDPDSAVQPMLRDSIAGETIDSNAAATPVPLPLPETTIIDTVSGIDTTGRELNPPVEMPDSNTAIAAEVFRPFIPHLYLTAGKLNFESAESDIIDIMEQDDDDQEEEEKKLFSVMLDNNPRASGLPLLIPGGVMATIGGLVTVSILDNYDKFLKRPDGLLAASSFLAVGGATLVTFGVRQMRIHIRWSNRYHRSAAAPYNRPRIAFIGY